MGLAVKNPEVNGEHPENKDVKSDPKKYPIRIHDCHFSLQTTENADGAPRAPERQRHSREMEN